MRSSSRDDKGEETPECEGELHLERDVGDVLVR
jgi:hypothetical protein